jgi:hypothetical protein
MSEELESKWQAEQVELSKKVIATDDWDIATLEREGGLDIS